MAKTREAHRYVGTVQSRHEVDQAFRVGGKVVERRVDVGAVVREGDVVAVLDDIDYRLAVQAAQQQLTAALAEAKQAESDRKRLEGLKLDGSVSESDEEHAQSNAETTKAAAEAQARQLELARNQLQYTVLRAPRRRCRHGLALRDRPGRRRGPAGRLARERGRARDRRRRAGGPRRHVQAGATTRPGLRAHPTRCSRSCLRELAPQAAVQTRTYRARLKPTPPRPLPLGATATLVVWRSGGGHVRPRVPAASLTQTKGQPALWVVRRSRQRAGRKGRAGSRSLYTATTTTRCSSPDRPPVSLSSRRACRRWRRDSGRAARRAGSNATTQAAR